MNSATLVQKLWSYCNVLRDDGTSDGDYVEQLAYLQFGKRAQAPRQPALARAFGGTVSGSPCSIAASCVA